MKKITKLNLQNLNNPKHYFWGLTEEKIPEKKNVEFKFKKNSKAIWWRWSVLKFSLQWGPMLAKKWTTGVLTFTVCYVTCQIGRSYYTVIPMAKSHVATIRSYTYLRYDSNPVKNRKCIRTERIQSDIKYLRRLDTLSL